MVTSTPPPVLPRPRGGAAKAIRTGGFIRQWLMKVGEDTVTGIHGALKSEIGQYNMLRPRQKWLGAPTYESFVKYFGQLRRLRLVEFVRDEPTEWAPPGLLSIRPPDQVVTTTRRVYRLTPLGEAPVSDILWTDPLVRGLLRQAFMAAMPGEPGVGGAS